MATKEEIMAVLENIHEKKNTSLTKIAEDVGYDIEKISDIVKYLEGKYLIDCEAKTMDGNIHFIKPTSEATDFLGEGLEIKKEPVEATINFHGRDMKVSNYKIDNPSFGNKGDVHLGDKVSIQNVTDNAKVYNVDRIDNSFIEKDSIKIINRYGEKRPKIFGIVGFVAGIVTIVTGITSYLTTDNVFVSSIKWLALFPKSWGIPLIVIGVVLLAFGSFLIRAIEHKYESRCPKCKRFYAVEEKEDPVVRDVDVKGGIRRTIKVKEGCKHEDCDYENVRTKNEFIENDQQQD
ncbi:MAG: hypothetical protein AABX33_00015 [Nanoarchaeota archaeon]